MAMHPSEAFASVKAHARLARSPLWRVATDRAWLERPAWSRFGVGAQRVNGDEEDIHGKRILPVTASFASASAADGFPYDRGTLLREELVQLHRKARQQARGQRVLRA